MISLFSDGPAGSIRGQKRRLVKQCTKISQKEHLILNRVIDNWNRVPPEVLAATSKDNFKKKIDQFLASD